MGGWDEREFAQVVMLCNLWGYEMCFWIDCDMRALTQATRRISLYKHQS